MPLGAPDEQIETLYSTNEGMSHPAGTELAQPNAFGCIFALTKVSAAVRAMPGAGPGADYLLFASDERGRSSRAVISRAELLAIQAAINKELAS